VALTLQSPKGASEGDGIKLEQGHGELRLAHNLPREDSRAGEWAESLSQTAPPTREGGLIG